MLTLYSKAVSSVLLLLAAFTTNAPANDALWAFFEYSNFSIHRFHCWLSFAVSLLNALSGMRESLIVKFNLFGHLSWHLVIQMVSLGRINEHLRVETHFSCFLQYIFCDLLKSIFTIGCSVYIGQHTIYGAHICKVIERSTPCRYFASGIANLILNDVFRAYRYILLCLKSQSGFQAILCLN